MFKVGDRVRLNRNIERTEWGGWASTCHPFCRSKKGAVIRKIIDTQIYLEKVPYHYSKRELELALRTTFVVNKTKRGHKRMAKEAKKSKFEQIKDAILENTAQWVADEFTVSTKQSEKGKKLSALLSALTVSKSDKEKLADMFTEISGEDVAVEKDEEFEFPALVAIVITKGPTDKDKHTYETERVILTTGDGAAIDHAGKPGSNVPPKRSFVRPATEKEMNDIPESQIKALMKEANIQFIG